MIDIYDYLCFDGIDRSWTSKVEYILKSESQRADYKKLITDEEKVDFFLNHFVMNDLAIRQLNNACQNNTTFAQEFIKRIDHLIGIMEDNKPTSKLEIPTNEKIHIQ